MADPIAAPNSSGVPRSTPEGRALAANSGLRLRLFAAFILVLILVAAGWGIWWLWEGRGSVSTDNAYVDAEVAQITPQIDGMISEVPVTDTMPVKRGQLLVRISPTDARIVVAEAEANYAQALRRVWQYFANAEAAAALVAARRADVARARDDYTRRNALAKSGAVSGDELTAAENALATARAQLIAAQRNLESQRALIRDTDVDHHPEVMAAKAARDRAELELARTVITAPFDGVVAQNSAQIGQRARVGGVLMEVIPLDRVYVNANFKEGQLTRVHTGQAVTLTSDLYGASVFFHGKVAGLGGGTGSAFSVIPAQNATGNWIKVVQRLPVRVSLDPRELVDHPLRVGLSMNATIELSK